MRLKLDLNGILVQLNIKRYAPSSEENWDNEWCDVDFSFSSNSWLNYYKENDEVLLACEIESLARDIHRLLNDELTEVTTVTFIEPDFKFILHPKRDIREDHGCVYVREGYEMADIYVDWTVTFWNDGLTDNYLSVTLDRNDLQALLSYLYLVIGKYKETCTKIRHLIRLGILIP